MTREEAIEYLKSEFEDAKCDDSEYYQEWADALYMAITSLEVDEAYSLGYENVGVIERSVIDKAIKEIKKEKEFAYADFERYKVECLGVDADDLPDDDFRYGMERALEILYRHINKEGGE